MKILITTDWYRPVINGVVTSVVNLEAELEKKGHDVKILTLSDNHHSRRENNVYYMQSFNMDKIYPNARASLFVNKKYLDEIIQWKPEVIHSQCEFTSFIFAKKIACKLNIPIVHTYHTIYENYTHYFSPVKTLGKKAVAVFSKDILNKVNAVIAPTEKVNKLLLGYGVDTEIYTVPTGIDLNRFNMTLPDALKRKAKESLKIPEGNAVLVSIGRLAKEKNLDQIIGYMKRMETGNITLLIVGDGPYRQKLEKDVRDSGLEGKVIFTGMIAPEEIPYYYHLGDIFVSASNSETQGLTYMEALASGLPAICRRDPCIEDVVIDGYNGFQYDSFDSFKDAVSLILSDIGNYRKLSGNAKAVANRYSTLNFAEKLENIYKRVI